MQWSRSIPVYGVLSNPAKPTPSSVTWCLLPPLSTYTASRPSAAKALSSVVQLFWSVEEPLRPLAFMGGLLNFSLASSQIADQLVHCFRAFSSSGTLSTKTLLLCCWAFVIICL